MSALVPWGRFAYDLRMLKVYTIIIVLLSVPVSLVGVGTARAQQAAPAATPDDSAAIVRYQAMVTKEPGDYESWFGLGVAQARQHHYQDAITAFRQVISLKPALAEPHNNLAVIYNELGDLRAAVAELETSLKLDPAYATAYENIGDLYVKLAANAYKQALQKHDSAELKQRYARLLHLHDAASPANEPPLEQDSAVAGEGRQAVTPATPSVAEAVHITPTLPAESAVLSAVEAWRSAWSKRDTAAYFNAYADDFDTGKRFGSLAAWKKYKRSVIGKRTFIRVTLKHVKAVQHTDGFHVTFTQHFRSDAFDSDDQKELLLRQTPDGWKIIHETTQ